MKRFLIGLAGLFYGLLLMGIYILVSSHHNWSPVDKLPASCQVDDCHFSIRLLLFFDIFGPALIFFILNIWAWKRWTLRKWMQWLAGLTALTCCYWLFVYISQ